MNTTIHRQTAESISFTDQYQQTRVQLYHYTSAPHNIVQFDHFLHTFFDYRSHLGGRSQSPLKIWAWLDLFPHLLQIIELRSVAAF
jgi:hypothetical protein